MFDLFLGLPLHPLVVHFVVILLPLSALSLAVAAFSPGWRARAATPSFVLLTVAVIFAFVAKEAGEALAGRVGTPEVHAEWGDRLFLLSLVLWVVALVWVLLRRRAAPRLVAGVLMAVLAVAATGVVTYVGHTGSTAAWQDVASGSATAPNSSDGSYTMTQVAQHADASSCWAAIDGGVYDLTPWIAEHPGGEERILGLCGTDASTKFEGKHGEDTGPQQALTRFRIGDVQE